MNVSDPRPLAISRLGGERVLPDLNGCSWLMLPWAKEYIAGVEQGYKPKGGGKHACGDMGGLLLKLATGHELQTERRRALLKAEEASVSIGMCRCCQRNLP